MSKTGWWFAAAVLAAGVAAAAPGAPPAASSPALDRFKGLVGDWVAAEDSDMVKKGDLVASYHVTAGGSAVVEELMPGMPHQMTTVYYLDGKDLVLTHYCMNGNQPHMRAKAPNGSKIEFAFDGGSNIDAKTTEHMHQAAFDFVGPNELKSTWVEWNQGKVSMTVNMHVVRKSDVAAK